MCIAILKKAGVEISKDKLLNGWRANDDGAGFCCIDENGEFIIHHAMDWDGFYTEYEKCVNQYGDTSDFLIHFRITSKGSTNLANCHPFQVDRDRVIIHNGTISNIHIEKEDTRSDTKVFAQDWLPNLPENWEDNEIIRLFLEEFIGWSKIIMLHRTKGAIIFNEDKGHWFEGNWYSNESYKPKTLSSTNTYAGGYWDTDLRKWVTWDEKRALLDRKDNSDEYADTYKWSSKWDKCDKCKCLVEEDELDIVEDVGGVIEYWCSDCREKLESGDTECSYCGGKFFKGEIGEFWDAEAYSVLNLCLDCYEVLDSTGIILEDMNKIEKGAI